MQITEIRCDRCGKTTTASGAGRSWSLVHKSGVDTKVDLCCDCQKALQHFMDGDDQVGPRIFVLGDGPCPHHVSCAALCTSEWQRIDRPSE